MVMKDSFNKKWLNATETGKYLSISQPTLRQWVIDGIIPYVSINGIKRFYIPDIDEAHLNQ
jgi:predicted site-specific integrase-resolvase